MPVMFPSVGQYVTQQPQQPQQPNFSQFGRGIGQAARGFANSPASSPNNWLQLARGLMGVNPQGQVPGGFGNYMSSMFGGSGGWGPTS